MMLVGISTAAQNTSGLWPTAVAENGAIGLDSAAYV